MKTWLLLLSGLISACATVDAPAPIFEDYPLEEVAPAVLPVELPQLHEGQAFTVDGVVYFGFSLDGAAALDLYVIAAEANQIISLESATTVNALNAEVQALTRAGRATERRLARRVDELNQERAEHFRTTWFYRVLLVVFGVALVAG